jgi:hypothetical protein
VHRTSRRARTGFRDRAKGGQRFSSGSVPWSKWPWNLCHSVWRGSRKVANSNERVMSCDLWRSNLLGLQSVAIKLFLQYMAKPYSPFHFMILLAPHRRSRMFSVRKFNHFDRNPQAKRMQPRTARDRRCVAVSIADCATYLDGCTVAAHPRKPLVSETRGFRCHRA